MPQPLPTSSTANSPPGSLAAPDREADLARMKRFATGMLLAVASAFVATRVVLTLYADATWLTYVGYLEAMCEAAMIGALADWFAVTALFRHPMGIPIPHTAIIPARKDSIASQFGSFVQDNFLANDLISERVHHMHLARRAAAWMQQEDNAADVSQQLVDGLAGAVEIINDEDIQRMLERSVRDRVMRTSFSPVLSEFLGFVTSGRRQQMLFDAGVRAGLYLLDDSEEGIRETVKQETPWWFPATLDSAIYRRIVMGVSKTLYAMQNDIYHPLRVRLVGILDDFITDLKTSDDFHAQEEQLKIAMLDQPALREFVVTLWADIREAILARGEADHSTLKEMLTRSIMKLGEAIDNDPELAAKLDGWCEDSARYVINNYGHEFASLIETTIRKWDTEATSRRIELQIGLDLQFIRINGTVVGGLVGLAIHGILHLIEIAGVGG